VRKRKKRPSLPMDYPTQMVVLPVSRVDQKSLAANIGSGEREAHREDVRTSLPIRGFLGNSPSWGVKIEPKSGLEKNGLRGRPQLFDLKDFNPGGKGRLLD